MTLHGQLSNIMCSYSLYCQIKGTSEAFNSQSAVQRKVGTKLQLIQKRISTFNRFEELFNEVNDSLTVGKRLQIVQKQRVATMNVVDKEFCVYVTDAKIN